MSASPPNERPESGLGPSPASEDKLIDLREAEELLRLVRSHRSLPPLIDRRGRLLIQSEITSFQTESARLLEKAERFSEKIERLKEKAERFSEEIERLKGKASRAGGPVRAMEVEHEQHGEDLLEIRRLTGDLVAPDEACTTWRALYIGLQQLEQELMDHIHLENNILFRRALTS